MATAPSGFLFFPERSSGLYLVPGMRMTESGSRTTFQVPSTKYRVPRAQRAVRTRKQLSLSACAPAHDALPFPPRRWGNSLTYRTGGKLPVRTRPSSAVYRKRRSPERSQTSVSELSDRPDRSNGDPSGSSGERIGRRLSGLLFLETGTRPSGRTRRRLRPTAPAPSWVPGPTKTGH